MATLGVIVLVGLFATVIIWASHEFLLPGFKQTAERLHAQPGVLDPRQLADCAARRGLTHAQPPRGDHVPTTLITDRNTPGLDHILSSDRGDGICWAHRPDTAPPPPPSEPTDLSLKGRAAHKAARGVELAKGAARGAGTAVAALRIDHPWPATTLLPTSRANDAPPTQKPFRVGDPRFDQSWACFSENPEIAHQLLNGAVRAIITEIGKSWTWTFAGHEARVTARHDANMPLADLAGNMLDTANAMSRLL